MLLDFLAFYRAVTDFGINIAELERVVGVELSRGKTIESETQNEE